MPFTRSKRFRAAPESTTVVTSDDERTSPIEAGSTQPPASFKSQLIKFEYIENTSPSQNDATADQSKKRARPVATTFATTTTRTSAPGPRPTKKQRKPSKYADPSKYAHLSPLVDILEPNLICVFVGTNPGVSTATQGHAYAHPSNHFWKLLHSSSLTDRRLKPEEDRSLPALYCMGNTNIVERPSKDAAELSKEEMTAGTARLDEKFRKYKPEAVCIVGKGIWEAIWRYRYGRNMKKSEFKFGWQDEKDNMGRAVDGEEEVDEHGKVWDGARVFVTTSTSGLAASLKPAEKEAIWKPFGEWVMQRRVERGFVPRVEDVQTS